MNKTFQPDSLHPYIMDARLKKATGSGGISNIPIASADTVGGIMIGGSANPITITGSGNASVRKATSELLGVVKAGDGVTVDADGAISGTQYSTTEHKTGRKWIDGKDIFEKVITFENPIIITSEAIKILDTPPFDTLIKSHYLGVVPSTTGAPVLYMQSDDLYVASSTDFTTKHIIIEYTKTS